MALHKKIGILKNDFILEKTHTTIVDLLVAEELLNTGNKSRVPLHEKYTHSK